MGNEKLIPFEMNQDFLFYQKEFLPKHSNGMKFTALDSNGIILFSQIYYSTGGGFILTEEEFSENNQSDSEKDIPYSFKTSKELLTFYEQQNTDIVSIVLENELIWCSKEEVYAGIKKIAKVMTQCIEKGCQTEGILPGGLQVKRRAATL